MADGLQTKCKPCQHKLVLRWQHANKEKYLAYLSDWRKRNHAKVIAWVLACTTRLKSTPAGRKKHRRWQKEWIRKNRAKVRDYGRRGTALRRARIKATETAHITSENLSQIYACQKGRCFYCKKRLMGKFEMEHYIPLSRGGPHTVENIVASCSPCNRKKHTKIPGKPLGKRRLAA